MVPIKVQEAYRIPNRIDRERNSPQHTTNKTLNIQDKQRILKAAKEKDQITYKGGSIRTVPDFSGKSLKIQKGLDKCSTDSKRTPHFLK